MEKKIKINRKRNVMKIKRGEKEEIKEGNGERRIKIILKDIVEKREGMVEKGERNVREIIDFVKGWKRKEKIIINCYEGI